jgi:hypothetical protein
MGLILNFDGLLEGGEGILDQGRQDAARVSDAGADARAGVASTAGGLADRAPLTFRRLVRRRLVGGRVPHVGAGFPVLAQRPLDLIGDLIGHAASAGLYQPALEISDGITGPGRLAGAAGLTIGTRLAAAPRRAAGS